MPTAPSSRKNMRPFCNETIIRQHIRNKYVFWLDLMGAQNTMAVSLPKASNYVLKIHVAALRANEHLHAALVPVVDGVYCICDERSQMFKLVHKVMDALALTFVLETDNAHRFLVRGGISYGLVVHGDGLAAASDTLKANRQHLASIAIGMAISNAYQAEKQAPPFGIFVHESARAAAPENHLVMTDVFHSWYDETNPVDAELLKDFRPKFKEYYSWVRKNHRKILYPQDRIEEHYRMAEEYFCL